MPVLTSREFNQDVARAKRAANEGPVIITDRGRLAYVLMRYDTYQRSPGSERVSAACWRIRKAKISSSSRHGWATTACSVLRSGDLPAQHQCGVRTPPAAPDQS